MPASRYGRICIARSTAVPCFQVLISIALLRVPSQKTGLLCKAVAYLGLRGWVGCSCPITHRKPPIPICHCESSLGLYDMLCFWVCVHLNRYSIAAQGQFAVGYSVTMRERAQIAGPPVASLCFPCVPVVLHISRSAF